MKETKLSCLALLLFLFFCETAAFAQTRAIVVAGMISVDDKAPSVKKYALFSDTLDRRLKQNPNDTTSLFFRALLYLQFNKFTVRPDLEKDHPATDCLLLARKMVNRADSLKMKSFQLKVLRAGICKELAFQYAPVEEWRFNARQIADRKRKFDLYKVLANKYYDELANFDKENAYDYQRLKMKDFR